MICFVRASHCSLEFSGPAAELRMFADSMRRTGAVTVDLEMTCKRGQLLFPSHWPFLVLLPPIGVVWADEKAYSHLAVDVAQELERQEAYRDWAEQRYAAARGLA